MLQFLRHISFIVTISFRCRMCRKDWAPVPNCVLGRASVHGSDARLCPDRLLQEWPRRQRVRESPHPPSRRRRSLAHPLITRGNWVRGRPCQSMGVHSVLPHCPAIQSGGSRQPPGRLRRRPQRRRWTVPHWSNTLQPHAAAIDWGPTTQISRRGLPTLQRQRENSVPLRGSPAKIPNDYLGPLANGLGYKTKHAPFLI